MAAHNPGSDIGAGYRYLGVCLTLAGAVILFTAGGYGLDRWLGTLPAGTIIGALAGTGLGFFSVFRRLNAEQAARKQTRP